jgi:ABC-type uncharacterized transport system permease subunit
MELTIVALSGGCYLAATLLAVAVPREPRPARERAVLSLMGAGALLLGAVLLRRCMQAGGLPVFTRFEALACYAIALSATYLILLLPGRRPLHGIHVLILPYTALLLACGFPALADPTPAPPPPQGAWVVLHVVAGFAAYAVFTLLSLLAFAYLVQDRNLKRKQFNALGQQLPSLETLDRLMSRLAVVAFLLFTLAIILGFRLVLRSGGGAEWFTDPKVGASLATWIVFGVLVHLRANADRHGRGVALFALTGLACLLFSFLGVHLVADSVHAFLQLTRGSAAP